MQSTQLVQFKEATEKQYPVAVNPAYVICLQTVSTDPERLVTRIILSEVMARDIGKSGYIDVVGDVGSVVKRLSFGGATPKEEKHTMGKGRRNRSLARRN